MHSARSHIAHGHRKRGRKLARHAQIPLHYVIAFRELLHIGAQLGTRLLNKAGVSAGWKRTRGKRIRKNRMYEWIRALKRQIEFIRQRQHIENSKTTSYQCLPAPRIPGQPQARLEISQRGVVEEWGAHARLRI